MSTLTKRTGPKNGKTYKVLIIARVSTKNQDLQSLEDQIAICKREAIRILDGPIEFVIIKSQESGELLDRQTLVDAMFEVETGQLDMVILEDLARLSRRHFANSFCELCVDKDTQLIAINDHINTASDNWQVNSLVTTFLHEQHNLKGSLRIKERKREKFKGGGALACPIYGYLKPPGAKTDQELQKDPSAQTVIEEVFRRLEDGAGYSEVADYLNQNNIPTGPYCRQERWDCRIVGRFVHNPILKGVRVRNRKETRRINKTGKHRSFNASPEMLLQRPCPHLAFIEPERFDRVIAMLRAKNANYARGRAEKNKDCRLDVSKKTTVWPGQHLECGVCNRTFYWGGHGVKEHMMCSGCRDYRCWNATSVDGFETSRRLAKAVLDEIQNLPDFDSLFLEKLQEQIKARLETRDQELTNLEGELNSLERQMERLIDAIATTDGCEPLTQRLNALTVQRDQVRQKKARILKEPTNTITLPSMAEIRVLATKAINELATDSPEFGRLMKRLIPDLKVFPHRLCDGGAVVLRAVVKLDLTSLANLPQVDPAALDALRRVITVDLFDPVQRVEFRERIIAMRAEGMTEKAIAKALGLTVTATQRASSLTRMMEQLGLSDPYVPLSKPPDDCTKWKRHSHERFSFEPLTDKGPA